MPPRYITPLLEDATDSDWSDLDEPKASLFDHFEAEIDTGSPSGSQRVMPFSSPTHPTRVAPADQLSPRTPQPTFPSSDGPVRSSIVRGDKATRAAIRRKKGYRKQQIKMMKRHEDERKQKTETLQGIADEVLAFMQEKRLPLLQLLNYIFDPSRGQGKVRWHEFFVVRGAASQILDWWVSPKNSQEAQREVHNWAVDHVRKAVSKEAQHTTKYGLLRTSDKTINSDVISKFDFHSLHRDLDEEWAPITMQILSAVATSRHAEKHTEKRKEKTRLVGSIEIRCLIQLTYSIIGTAQVTTAAALTCLGEYSHANNLVKRIMALYLHATGAHRQTINVLAKLGQCESYSNLTSSRIRRPRKLGKSILNSPLATESGEGITGPSLRPHASQHARTLDQLSESVREESRQLAATGIYGSMYDNVNFAFNTGEQILGRHGR